jgi:hypothetical protein
MMFQGEVAEPGFGHFRKHRPKFYKTVLALSGVVLYPGTINVRIDGETPHFPLPNTQRIPGQDQLDLDHNQDILITPCVMEVVLGFGFFRFSREPGTRIPRVIFRTKLLKFR